MVSRNWVFTLNNPEDDQEPGKWQGIQYGVWQKERGAEGTEHLQGYVVVPQCTIAAMKKRNPRAHWEVRRGSHVQAKEYCTKEDTRIAGPWVTGKENEPVQGKRTDLMALKEAVDAGVKTVDLWEQHFTTMVKFERGITKYQTLKGMRQRRWRTFTTVYWGPPGTGKTTRAKTNALQTSPDPYWMKKPGNNQSVFFDGYDGQEDVVIDEFYGWLPFDLLCRMCDENPLLVDTKGGAIHFAPKRIWITSNSNPEQWYKRGLGAMHRRLIGGNGKIEYMDKVMDPGLLEELNRVGQHPVEARDVWHDKFMEDQAARVGEKRVFGALDYPLSPLPSFAEPPSTQPYNSDAE